MKIKNILKIAGVVSGILIIAYVVKKVIDVARYEDDFYDDDFEDFDDYFEDDFDDSSDDDESTEDTFYSEEDQQID